MDPGTGTEVALKDDGEPVRIGVSSCLLGMEVRYDGGHKRDRWLTDVLGPFVEFVPVCPEVEVGLGTPRPTIRLERHGDAVRLVEPAAGTDLTATMERFAARRVAALERAGLDGYVLKKNSPSCGMERVKVRGPSGVARRDGVGVYARALLERAPLLPVEEEGRLGDPHLRESFVERVFARHRLRRLFRGRWTVGDLVRFHTGEKYLLLAHRPSVAAELGRLVARAKDLPRDELRDAYATLHGTALATPATVRRHVNVLEHMIGFLKDHMDGEVRRELAEVVADYRAGLLPLIVPVTLIRHLARRHGVTWLIGQRYLEPHPKELMIRNHV